MIDTLVFDIGSVLINIDRPLAYRKMGFSEEICRALLQIEPLEGFWDALDREDLTFERGAEIFAGQAGPYAKEAEYAFAHRTEYARPIQKNVDFLHSAKRAGYRVFYLSNFQRQNWQTLRQKVDFFYLFDGGIVSHSVRCIKPEPEIYRILIDRYALVPEDTLFIDDKAANIMAAREFGMQGIVLQEETDLFWEAKKFGVEV